jgi:hypothetical protein
MSAPTGCPRIHTLLEFGESRPFDPFDCFAQLKESEGKSLEDPLDEFAEIRRENLARLKAFDFKSEELSRRGLYPSLGVSPCRSCWPRGRLTT